MPLCEDRNEPERLKKPAPLRSVNNLLIRPIVIAALLDLLPS